MSAVTLMGQDFEILIPSREIKRTISRIAQQMNLKLKGKNIVFIGILNGAFMFAAELLKQIDFPCRISFLKLESYSGTSSTGTVTSLIGLGEDISNSTVIVLEDIVDTGLTIARIVKQLELHQPLELKIATLLFKPAAYKENIKLDYVGFEIPNRYVIGFGLDYNGYGRNFKNIYVIKNN
jgi:hypoxanthine phosphoribosyltransferase